MSAPVLLPEHLRPLPGETDTAYKDRMLLVWDTAKTTLETAKAAEMELRKLCATLNFENPSVGTNRVQLGNGYALKMVRKVNYSFTDASLDDIEKAEDDIAAIGNEGAFLVERLFKWSCEPVPGEYKKLDASNPTHAKIKSIYDKILTAKDATPTLEIEAPKVKA